MNEQGEANKIGENFWNGNLSFELFQNFSIHWKKKDFNSISVAQQIKIWDK